MATVSDVVLLPDGTVDANAVVAIELVGADPEVGWVTASDQSIVGRTLVRTNASGVWSATLKGNTSITPSGTRYKVTVRSSGGGVPAVYYITVPSDSATYHPYDILSSAPTSTAVTPTVSGATTPNTIVIFGDSITANNQLYTPASGIFWYQKRGYWTWADYRLRGRMRLLNNAGVGGDWTSGMLARIQADVLDYAAGWVLVQGGGNDIANGIATSTVIANLETMVDQIVAEGSRVILMTITPRVGFSTTQMRTDVQVVNKWMRDYAVGGGVVLFDAAPLTTDASTGDPLSGMYYDNTHPGPNGAARLGFTLADILDPLIPRLDILPTSPHETVSTYGTNLLENPLMTGSSGGVATSWAVSGSGSRTSTKVARTDYYPGEWQQLACSSGASSLAQTNTNLGTQWNVGDEVYAVAECESDSAGWAPSANSQALSLQVAFTGSSGSLFGFRDGGSDSPNVCPGNGVIVTPTIAIPTGTTSITVSVTMTGAGTIRVGRVGLYKRTTGLDYL